MSKDIRSGYYPSLVAYGSLSTSAQRNKFDIFDSDKGWYATGLIGATFNLPYLTGFKNTIR